MNSNKPVIGFTSGDLNGIGVEIIIKTLSDARMLDFFTPVIFASNKTINFYRKSLQDINFQFLPLKDFTQIKPKNIYIYNCWEEEVNITPGQLSEIGGLYAKKSLFSACQALKDQVIDGLVTAPIHKSNVYADDFRFSGHTPFLKDAFGAKDVAMLMVAPNMRVGLVTEHMPIQDVAQHITQEAILSKLAIINQSLKYDFGVDKPKIAVLGLNPHAGDEGLIGKEEQAIIIPAIQAAKQQNILAFGPYPADAFFARHQYEKFDAVLAMYHDQGLIPFKSLSTGEGVNYTAGLPIIRTSPDHGTAFDIAGKNKADHNSFMAAIFGALDIIAKRANYEDRFSNPMKRMSDAVVRKGEEIPVDDE